MTNQIAVGLGLVLVILLSLDIGANGGTGTMFLSRRFLDLLQLIAFWR